MQCKQCGREIEEKTGQGHHTHLILCKRCKRDRRNKYFSILCRRIFSEPLGTTNFDQEMCRKKDGTPNFKKEQQEIHKEIQRLGLKNKK